jgi:hypothetical protein
LANFDSFEDIVADVLERGDEPTDGNSDWDAATRRAVVRAFHFFNNSHPFWWLEKDPPGAFSTVAPITSLTLTVAAAGEGVAGTLSATYATSLAGYKILPTGEDYFMRVTAHTAGTAAVTLDTAPEALAAGTEITIIKDEYNLASDVGMLVDGLWTSDGHFIPLKSEDFIRQNFPDPPDQCWPPDCFTRLTKRKIRLSQYPDAVHRIEYPYTQVQVDPSGSGDLVIDQNFRWVLSDGGLYFLHIFKSDKRAEAAKQLFETGIGQAIVYHHRLKLGLTGQGQEPNQGPYSMSRR